MSTQYPWTPSKRAAGPEACLDLSTQGRRCSVCFVGGLYVCGEQQRWHLCRRGANSQLQQECMDRTRTHAIAGKHSSHVVCRCRQQLSQCRKRTAGPGRDSPVAALTRARHGALRMPAALPVEPAKCSLQIKDMCPYTTFTMAIPAKLSPPNCPLPAAMLQKFLESTNDTRWATLHSASSGRHR